MLTGPPRFQDPRELPRQLAQGVGMRCIAMPAAVANRPPPTPPTPPPKLKRTMREMVADLETKMATMPPPLILTPKDEPMPAQIKSLGEALQVAQDALPRAMAAAQKLVRNVGDLNDAVGQVEELSSQVAKHTAGVRALLGGISNGGPPLTDGGPQAQEKAL